MIKVLYIHPAGAFGGASRSLLDVIRSFESGRIAPFVLTKRGDVAARMMEVGIPVMESRGLSQWDNTSFGYYRGLRWLILLREIAYLPTTLVALLRAKRRWHDVDIVHLNEITLLPLLPLVRLIFGCQIVVHVRSTQQISAAPLRRRLFEWTLVRFADLVVPIDGSVRRTLPDRPRMEVVHNGFVMSAPAGPCDGVRADGARVRFAYIGGLMAAKGIHVLIEAARLCKLRQLPAEFWIVGGNVRTVRGVRGKLLAALGISGDVRAEIERRIATHDLGSTVQLLGFRRDVELIYQDIDVVFCLTVANAAGRPVFEAAFFGKPSIVAIDGSMDDTIIDGITGICVPPDDPNAVVAAVEQFCRDPQRRLAMGRAAKELALKNFDITRNAAKLTQLYEEVARGGRSPVAAADAAIGPRNSSATSAERKLRGQSIR